MTLMIILVERVTSLVFLANVGACEHQLDQGESCHVFAVLIIQVGLNYVSHAHLILLAVEAEDFLDLTKPQMEPFFHEPEEGVGQGKREGTYDEAAEKLDA